MPRARVHRHIHIIQLAALGPPQPPQGPLVVAAPTGVRRGPAAAARVRRVVGGEGPHGIRLLVSFDGIVDDLYDADFLASGLSPFQRSYAYVLGHGLDAVNADMQSFAHLEENLAAAATSMKAFA